MNICIDCTSPVTSCESIHCSLCGRGAFCCTCWKRQGNYYGLDCVRLCTLCAENQLALLDQIQAEHRRCIRSRSVHMYYRNKSDGDDTENEWEEDPNHCSNCGSRVNLSNTMRCCFSGRGCDISELCCACWEHCGHNAVPPALMSCDAVCVGCMRYQLQKCARGMKRRTIDVTKKRRIEEVDY